MIGCTSSVRISEKCQISFVEDTTFGRLYSFMFYLLPLPFPPILSHHYDWFQTKLYTRVPVNVTKRMKNPPFCGARSSINIWIIIFCYPTTPITLSKI